MAVKPPSTGSATPVMNDASSDTSQRAASAHSSGDAEPADRLRRLVRAPRGIGIGARVGELAQHRRIDDPRAERIDPDATLRVVEREGLGEHHDGALGGAVHWGIGLCHEPRLARREQQRTAARLLEHARDRRARRVDHSQQVDRQQALDLGVARVGEQLGERDARVAEEDVDSTVLLDAVVDGALVVGAARDIGGHIARAAAVLNDVAAEGLALLVAAVGDDEPCSFAREAKRRGAADPGACPGDDRRLAVQPHQWGRGARRRRTRGRRSDIRLPEIHRAPR